MIALIDYGMGNIKSVSKALETTGTDVKITQSPEDIRNAKAIVLPGVGAFRDCMKNLSKLELISVIKEQILKGKPYLGICLGMQILFTESEEFGLCKGLDIFKGKVVRFQLSQGYKIPHMGWNTVKFHKKSRLLEEIKDNSYFYFVHSYYVSPEDSKVVAGVTDYGVEFTSMIIHENIFATQFHPEKSQKTGLTLLRNFVKIIQ
ncbi:MAG TPA: imidazole glycerol phosphate synthase subunit HisH [Thermodesulfovibrio thiophilus]|uniref:imidazole glycerol phosphate synthase subunit HisH n=1 Tax=Thermodesulfovibrio thiophilus TaxID=340095 RepID=UPI00181CD259|nr:imidazole glycerol phosphate synthase subunit HisH [Thermodesulfovibrio thiophilus]HHW20298.1 imidazole glycerol phosphate synthase subunit HisH [Thermodesulfovibrio thiophilus]HOA82628.1 imidazole glycerol phosphate synthase subunit HisH [Thermodesulfovibrio thiophilus]HQA03357.1 imidazole glycerol phosphate synthase subunit HisH [Thermodesulfovibrio thiophilus]HQD35767.1 imidazole glycerol phosphate synthase subunit HisH [Thermodesulfovibrio thiophilus]